MRELRLAISAVTTTGYKQGFRRAIYHTGLEPDKDAPCTAKQDLEISFSAPKQTVYCTPISSTDVTFDILVLASPIHIPDSQHSIPFTKHIGASSFLYEQQASLVRHALGIRAITFFASTDLGLWKAWRLLLSSSCVTLLMYASCYGSR